MRRKPKILTPMIDGKAAAFWERVDKIGPDDCWNWTGGRSGDGYGVFRFRQYFRAGAHRIAFALGHQVEPGEGHVCHKCDNPLCCNPSHLFLGDAKSNMEDKVRKGRAKGRFSAKGSICG